MKKAEKPETVEAEVNDFTQLCVMHGTTMGEGTPEEFEKFIKDELNVRVKFETVIETLPDLDSDGNPVPETGGRSDLFFYIHTDDIGGFALKRLMYGIRWWEDVISYNAEHNAHLYTAEFKEKYPAKW